MVVLGVLKPRPEDAPEFRLCADQRRHATMYAMTRVQEHVGQWAISEWMQNKAARASRCAREAYEKEYPCK